MKRVVIVRHGKAVPYGYEDDFNRDLQDRGKKDAKLVSGELKGKNIFPDIIFSSPAKRAIKTARIYAENLEFSKGNIIENEEIYNGLTTSEFIEEIKQISEEHSTVFFFGHNPGFHYFANHLLQNNELYHLPTSGTVVIDFDVKTWQDVEIRTGKTNLFLAPKMLK